MELKEVQNLVNETTNMLNSFSDENMETFVKQMNFQHRTLQQNFTKMCLKWIENVGSDDYRYDGRNQYSHEICKEIVDKVGKDFPLNTYLPTI